MKYFAVVSDIHANRPALESVMRDAENIAGDAPLFFINLGDVVDYGPHPNDCIAMIKDDQRFLINVCGNHDQEMKADLGTSPEIDERHWAFTLWTRKILLPEYHDLLAKWCSGNQIRNHGIDELKQFIFIHGGLNSDYAKLKETDTPNLEYVKSVEGAGRQFKRLNNHNACIGHTHLQGYFTLLDYDQNPTPEMRLAVPPKQAAHKISSSLFEIPSGVAWKTIPEEQVIFNPGSVGQARWHAIIKDAYPNVIFPPIACYMLFKVRDKDIQFSFRQLPYRHQATIFDLEKVQWPKKATKSETKIVAKLLEKLLEREHSAYREPVITRNPSSIEASEVINQILRWQIKSLIRAIDPSYQE